MDNTTKALADYALGQTYESLDEKTIRAAIRHHLDGVGCAAGGFSCEPCVILRNLAASVQSSTGISAYGVLEPSIPEYAIIANVAANRHLDFNDTAVDGATSGTHPNDMTPAIVAAVEAIGGSGKDIILGTHIGYEIVAALGRAFDFRTQGWDQSTQIGVAVAIAAGRLLGLDAEGIGNAISMTVTPGSSLRVTRAGKLSHWKGVATAQAAMHAYFCARLARDGLTGPPDVFEGVDGFWKQISRRSFNLDHLGQPVDGLTAMERANFKYFPTEYNSQGPVAALFKLRKQFGIDEIESVKIETYWLAWHEIGGGQGDAPEKWDPKTRESADHSLPYLTAVALAYGIITLDSFAPARVRDPALRPLMKKVTIAMSPELDERFNNHGEYPADIEITLKDGRVFKEKVDHLKGSWQNPMTDDELNAKFDNMINYVLRGDDARTLRDMLWNLDKLKTITDLTANFRNWKIQQVSTAPRAQQAAI